MGILAVYLLKVDPTTQTVATIAQATHMPEKKCIAYLRYKGYNVSEDGTVTMKASVRKEIDDAHFAATHTAEEVIERMKVK